MHLKLLADECLDFRIVQNLRKKGFEIKSILEDCPGINDKDVLITAIRHNAILITEDRDFGEWIFAHKESVTGVIYLRYKAEELEKISSSLIRLISKYGTKLYSKFTVVTAKKIRIRQL